MLIPTVIETTNRGERAYDIYSRLLRERIVFLGTALDESVANLIIAQLLHLEGEDMDRPVNLYINSPGGDMTALFAVYDAMQFMGPPVHTVCVGQACSAAAVLLAAGEPGPPVGAAQRPHPHPPAPRRRPGPVDRHGDPGPRDGDHARADGRHPHRAHRPDPRAHRGRHRPRLHPAGRRGRRATAWSTRSSSTAAPARCPASSAPRTSAAGGRQPADHRRRRRRRSGTRRPRSRTGRRRPAPRGLGRDDRAGPGLDHERAAGLGARRAPWPIARPLRPRSGRRAGARTDEERAGAHRVARARTAPRTPGPSPGRGAAPRPQPARPVPVTSGRARRRRADHQRTFTRRRSDPAGRARWAAVNAACAAAQSPPSVTVVLHRRRAYGPGAAPRSADDDGSVTAPAAAWQTDAHGPPAADSPATGSTLAADAYGPDDGPPVVLLPRRRPDPPRLGRHGPPARRQGLAGHHRRPPGPRRQRLGRASDGDATGLDAFAADMRAVAAAQSRPPVLDRRVARRAQLAGRHRRGARRRRTVASGLVLVDVAPAPRAEGHRAHRRVHARPPRRVRRPRRGRRRGGRLQPAPAPADRPVGPAQERAPAATTAAGTGTGTRSS